MESGCKAHHRYARSARRDEAAAFSEATRRIVEAGASSSVATRPGATSPVPEVTIKGRSEPASTERRVYFCQNSVVGCFQNSPLPKIPMRRVGRVRDIASEAGGSLSVRAGRPMRLFETRLAE